MTSSPLVRTGAVAAPVLLFGYGVLRLIDGLDGHRDKGAWMWNTGHVMFFAAMVLLGALAVGARRMLPSRDFGNRLASNLAVIGALAGTAAFLWVIAGDLVPSFADAAPLPGPLSIAGNAVFVLGLVTLLFQLVRAHRLPAWSPVAVLFAFLLIPVSLDLIPAAAVLLAAGLLPLAGGRARLSPAA
ncbi:hypothetical protein ABT369_07945 [Dactylosporangium sp. NPDC000244]|uniref:hypothetical protein n=1 Tax=Dactylosporangium sp. NPDC000244 TaxID=3154365 RepID=UPI003318E8CC